MTKEQAREAKKIIKLVGDFKMVFISKTEELRVRVATYVTNEGDAVEAEKKKNANIIAILNALSKRGYRPRYRQDFKQYEHIINDYFIVFR